MGASKFLTLRGRDGAWRSSYLFLKKPITLVLFRGGGGGPDLLTPTSLWIQKSRESVETIDTPKYRVVQQLRVDITNSVMSCSGQNSSITKDDNF